MISFNNIKDFNKCSKKLLEKFTHLRELELEGRQRSNHNISEIIATINEKQLCLEKVMFWGVICNDVLTRFGLLFADKLKYIDINSGNYCLNDKQLSDSRLLSRNLGSISVYHKIRSLEIDYLPQLTELLDVNIDDLSGLQSIIEYDSGIYLNQIKKISFFPDYYLENAQQIGQMLEQLSRFKCLESLDFYFSKIELNLKFKPIEKNCQKLRELHIFGKNSYLNLKRLRKFKELRVLGLYFDCMAGKKLKFSYLRELDLTEVWMYCDIKLKQLKSILEMKNLTKLHIKSNFIYEKQICEIIFSSTHLKTIYLEDVLITKQTIGAFVQKALQNPSIQYNMISDCYEEHRYDLSVFKRLTGPEFPKNLNIIIKI